MDQQIINLFNEYSHKPLKRSEYINRQVACTGSLAAATSVLPLRESCAAAGKTATGDLFIKRISYGGSNGRMDASIARRKTEKKFGAVMVIHEKRGAAHNLQNCKPGFEYLETRNGINAATGCVGFCGRGAMANNQVVQMPELDAAVVLSGSRSKITNVPKIKAAMHLHFGGPDERIHAAIPAYEALKEAGIRNEAYRYDAVKHAFHNDTSAARYNKAAAKLAWHWTIRLFNKHREQN